MSKFLSWAVHLFMFFQLFGYLLFILFNRNNIGYWLLAFLPIANGY